VQQARELGTALRSRYGDEIELAGRIYSSTAIRAFDTAKHALQNERIVRRVIQEDTLLEVAQGDWEEQERSRCITPEVIRAQAANPYDFKAPGGESVRDVENRVSGFISRVVNELEHENDLRPVLIFTHGFVIKCFLMHVMRSDPRMAYKTIIANTGISQFGYRPEEGWFLLSVNEHSHLATS